MKRYLFFVSLSYAYPILRPIQSEIWRRGDDVAWFFTSPCDQYLHEGEKQLKTIKEVMEYNPIAVFAPGNKVHDFFPGVKVQVFHGFSIDKRPGRGDHFRIRGLFDIFCTQGSTSTPHFLELEKQYRHFKIYETGWSKTDLFFPLVPKEKNPVPTILYASTFTPGITSTPHLYDEIARLAKEKNWQWLITFHPKMSPEIVEKYKNLANALDNVSFYEGDNNVELLQKADVLLCDSSSIIIEFLFFDKPVVTYKNTSPGNYLIDVDSPELIEPAIEKALTRPKELMDNIRKYTDSHQPYRDGRCSARILDAVDDFIAKYKGKIKRKPLNLFRKLQTRWQVKYFPFGPRYTASK